MNIVIHHAKKEIAKLEEMQKHFPNERAVLEELKIQWQSLILRERKKAC